MVRNASFVRLSAYGLIVIFGVLFLWIAFSFGMMLMDDGWAEIRYEPAPTRYFAPWVLSVTKLMLALTGIGLLSLIASAVWRVFGIGAERVREAPQGAL